MAKFLKLQNCQTCKRKIDLFDCLSKEELARINETRYEVQFNAGETIFKQGTSFTHAICITSGLVKIYLEGYNRKNFILRLSRAGEVIGGPGMLVDNMHHYCVSAIEDSTACFIDLNVFQEVLRSNNEFVMEMLRRSNMRDIQHFDKIIGLTQKQMPGRVADLLLYLHKEIYKTNPFYLTITRQDMADMAAITKESLIRILKEFKDTGFITLEGNELRLQNEKVLQNISENG